MDGSILQARLRDRRTGLTVTVRFHITTRYAREEWRRWVLDSWLAGPHSDQELRRLYFSIWSHRPLGEIAGPIDLLGLWLDGEELEIGGSHEGLST